MTDMVVFGEDLGGLPSSTQHLIRHLAKCHRILWVNSIGLRQPKFTPKDVKRLLHKLKHSITKQKAREKTPFSHQEETGINTITLLTIPAPGSKWTRKVATQMMKHQLSKKLNEIGFRHAIFWTSLPTAVDICKQMNARGIVYYCGDDFGALAGVDHRVVLEHEIDLVDCADLILVANEELADDFPQEKTVTISHGVDFSLFSEPVVIAKDMPNKGQKVLGFYGSLSEWLDYQLIEQVADQAPDWTLVFIGPNEFHYNPLPKRSNIHYLGTRLHQDLPRYSQHWDASWLPFIDNPQIRACNPLKLLEYLATGTPVISTPFPALKPYQHMLHVVMNVDDVCASLNHLLPPPEGSLTLIQQQGWESKAHQVDRLVRAL
ncbi:glycosyltransferase [Vibrio sp. AND4]|uniref:glycosyltransferase n=1 Tax=Vibrio sp. AND4 TaxID=314289 RepID=UPI00015EFA13|nr:glycosyltransferase [Vibrio sp. AND4]EDP60110.1 putative glycosyltransferase [Vibrio sp. AND4]